jgi:hypothetical protein
MLTRMGFITGDPPTFILDQNDTTDIVEIVEVYPSKCWKLAKSIPGQHLVFLATHTRTGAVKLRLKGTSTCVAIVFGWYGLVLFTFDLPRAEVIAIDPSENP